MSSNERVPGALFELPSVLVDRVVELALEEDLASGDLTTEACVDAATSAVANAVARQRMVACGGLVFARAFCRIDGSIQVEAHAPDGTIVQTGGRLWTVRGRARSLLMAERVALNLVQRMCGIATLTRAFVDAIPVGSRARITDTRKTMPGLRVLDRYSVRVGGGRNHRDDLGAGVLIKDNHITACGGIRLAIERARVAASHTAKIECEVETLAELDEALDGGAEIVLLDNMAIEEVKEAVRRTRGRALLEASGGVTIDRVASLAGTGVDAISVGALTHAAPSADIGLDFEVVSTST